MVPLCKVPLCKTPRRPRRHRHRCQGLSASLMRLLLQVHNKALDVAQLPGETV